MAGTFELLTATNGKFHWNLKAGNGQVILSSQQYADKGGASGGIASVQANCGDDACFDRKTSKANEPYFSMVAKNGQIIGRSEMYKSTASMEKGIASVKNNAPTAKTKDKTQK